MKNIRYILTLALIIFGISVYGQNKKSKFNRYDQPTPKYLLDQAHTYKESDPPRAIKLIEQLVSNKKEKRNYSYFGKAYFMLGEIYENIDQLDLALKRYNEALSYTSAKAGYDRANIHYRIGKISLTQKNGKIARGNFNECIKYALDSQQMQKCSAGLIDVLILEGQNKLALQSLAELETQVNNDSLFKVQVEARRSQIYTQMDDIENAIISIQNVYNTIPENVDLPEEEMEQVAITQDKLFQNVNLSNSKKIEIQSNLEYKDQNFNNNIARENLRISEVYEEENDIAGVLKSLDASKKFIDENAESELIAEVYKKSYEYNIKRGKSEVAFADLDKYVKAKERSIQELQNNLKQEVEIVKSQKTIDITQSEFKLQEKENDLMKNQLTTQKIVIGLLSLLFLGSLIFFYFLNRNIKAKNRANQLLELKSLRTQMNPHFIFNALNSVNNFIAKNDEKSANKYLSEFSKLMRMVLDYSKHDFITLREEIELNELYSKLEHFRFRDKFDYTFEDNIESDHLDIEVPPMLIQPFIENAVWHGLRYRADKGQLYISFQREENDIVITIKDNGIGRKNSKELKTKNQKNHKSTGLNNIKKRLDVLNTTYDKSYHIKVDDYESDADNPGTIVRIVLPITE